MLAHGVTGGITAELQGGSFGHGFFSAGLSKLVTGQFKYKDTNWGAIAGRTTVAAAVGGTISAVTGGKFANGARTAAMAHLLNAEGGVIKKRLAQQRSLDGVTKIETKDSILYERDGASVLVKNDILENGIPQVSDGRINDALDISVQEGQRVNIISGYRENSDNHKMYDAIDVYIKGYNSTQTARALYGSGYFHRVTGYPNSNLQSVHGDNRASYKGGCFVYWRGPRC